MAIAQRLADYLADAHLDYEVVEHSTTPSSSRTAQAAHVAGDRVAKAVLLRDVHGHLLAVLPSTHRIDLDAVKAFVRRDLELASEGEIGACFPDCERGAVPPVGAAYGLDTILDNSLRREGDIYFEAGDHQRLIKMGSAAFAKLLGAALPGQFSHHL